MSVCRPCNDEMIQNIVRDIKSKMSYTWKSDIKCFYDGSPYCTKRDYVLQMCVGEVWDRWDSAMVREIIRDNGGKDIIGGVYRIRGKREKFFDMAFDEKVRKTT